MRRLLNLLFPKKKDNTIIETIYLDGKSVVARKYVVPINVVVHIKQEIILAL